MTAASNKRAESKATRQRQLIDATVECIAEHGLSSLTLAQVAQQAGVSIGLINLHFQSKERLLEQTLQNLSDEYKAAWQQALHESGDDPAAQLTAMVELDFSKPISDIKRLAVWFAFWGETKVRPTYRKLCAGRDNEYTRILTEITESLLVTNGNAGVTPQTVAETLSALTDGLWLGLLLHPRQMSRKRAKQVCTEYLIGIFPGFPSDIAEYSNETSP